MLKNTKYYNTVSEIYNLAEKKLGKITKKVERPHATHKGVKRLYCYNGNGNAEVIADVCFDNENRKYYVDFAWLEHHFGVNLNEMSVQVITDW